MTRKLIAWLSSLSIILTFSVLPVSADHDTSKDIEPEPLNGNPSCSSVYSGSQFVFEVKLEPVDDSPIGGDPYSFNGFSGTIILTVDEGAKTFDYEITGNAAAVGVIVKGGPNANWYDYIGVSLIGPTNIGPQTSDQDLHAQSRNGGLFGLSHISFCMVQAKADPTIATQLKDAADDSNIADGASVPIGTTVYDTATLSGATSGAGGTVEYFYQLQTGATPDCSAGTSLGSVTVSGGVVPDSADVTLNTAGTYEFWAVYGGDGNNNGDTSTCGSETVVVAKNTPTIASQPAAQIRDSATVSGLTSDATGTITIRLFSPTNDTCDTSGTVAQTTTWTIGTDATVIGGSVGPLVTDFFGVTSNGTWHYVVYYSGDARNEAQESGCNDETVAITLTPAP